MTAPGTAWVSEISEILEAERKSLLTGDFETLSELVDRKQSAFDALPGLESLPDEDAAALRARARANQRLLDGAAAGLTEVKERLRQMRDVQEKLRTYDAQGARTEFVMGRRGKLERRA